MLSLESDMYIWNVFFFFFLVSYVICGIEWVHEKLKQANCCYKVFIAHSVHTLTFSEKRHRLFAYVFIFIFIITIFKDINANGKCLSLLSLLYGIKNVYLLCCLCLHKTAYYHFLNQVALTSLFLMDLVKLPLLIYFCLWNSNDCI